MNRRLYGRVHIINQRLRGNQRWLAGWERSMCSEEGRTLYAMREVAGWVGSIRSEERCTLYTMLELFIRQYMRLDFTAQKFEGYLIVYAGERSFLIISPFGWDRCVHGELMVYLEDAIIRRHG